ncbi:hypothetical protein [Agrobacterium tumefaciens]|uniref:hypothetical protein n=1 Tax=Agrobacterium tumefaciens TaxID=358 RepID=UPI003BA08264
MATYINQPMFPVSYLRPKRASFDNVGSGVDGGVNGTGQAITIETAGGGLVTASYEAMVLEGPDERHEIINWLGARLNGGFRFINVPIVNDKIGPFPFIRGTVRPIVDGIPHSDGALFSDDSGYSQATVWGMLLENAPLNAGQITMRVYGASRDLRWSDWLSIYHDQNGASSKGWRAWRYWESDKLNEGTETVDGVDLTFKDYRLAISPPLREATAAGTRIEAARPTCVMKIAKGETIPWDYEGWYSSRPSIHFVEAF